MDPSTGKRDYDSLKDVEQGLPGPSTPPYYPPGPYAPGQQAYGAPRNDDPYSTEPLLYSTGQPAASGYTPPPIYGYPHTDLGFTDKYVRHGFLRKVLGLLCAQLATTAVIASVFVLNEPAKNYLASNPWTLWLAIGLSFAFLLVLVCSEGARKSHPTNLILLFGFTAAESVLVGAVSATYDTDIVLLALAITATVTGALMLYAVQTKYDFTTSGGMLLGVLMALLVATIFGIFIQSRILDIVIAAVGAVLFSAYIVYDVQLVASGNHMYKLSPDEYVIAAINIYLDILNLFLYILQLLQQIHRH